MLAEMWFFTRGESMKTLMIVLFINLFISGCGVSYKYSIPEDGRIIVKTEKYYLVPGLERTLEYNISLEYMDSIFPMELLTNIHDICMHTQCNKYEGNEKNYLIYKYIGKSRKNRIEFVLFIKKK